MKFDNKSILIVILCLGGILSLSVSTKSKTKTHTKKIEAGMETESSTTVFEYLNNMNLNNNRNSNRNSNMNRNRQIPLGGIPSNSTAAGSNSTAPNAIKSAYVQDLNGPNTNLSDWMSISSNAFNNPYKFPIITSKDGSEQKMKFGTEQERLNEKYSSSANQGSLNAYNFWFKIRGGYIYYFATKEDINMLGSILVESVKNSKVKNQHSNSTASCFKVYDNSQDKFTICAMTMEAKLKWMCSLESFLKQSLDFDCIPDSKQANVTFDGDAIVQLKKIIQPVIIIPMASKMCNEKWTYLNKGKDWECGCSEGREQSPINLPTKDAAILSNLRPLFQYDIVNVKSTESSIDGLMIAGEYAKIRYERGAIRIQHPNMGKIVSLDGGVFRAEEIVFHTPAEHQINGEILDLEMQIIHYGKSKGDIAKQVVLSFLFKSKPGVYNKLIDKLDFFNLPNPIDNFRDITNDFFIPSIFYNAEDDDIPAMKPFSFFTYEGSLTSPPCTERTTHYVASDPIHLSNTVIALFKEALKTPDIMNEKGEMVISPEGADESSRSPQPLNGRVVYVYDHKKFNCPEFIKKKRHIVPKGHYEKREITADEYIYVNGEEPSGLPDSFVVSEQEAKGTDPNIQGDASQIGNQNAGGPKKDPGTSAVVKK